MTIKRIIFILSLNFVFSFQIFAQNIDIGIKSIEIPDYPRGDYVPFSNCPRSEVTKFEFRVVNRGDDFNKTGKAQFASVQIKRLSDGAILLNEEGVYSFSGFTPGWRKFRFDPIDLSEPGLYEVTVESYLIDLELYKKDKTLKPIDSDISDNKLIYINRVFNPESLEKEKPFIFNFNELHNKMDLVQEGWNYSYLSDSIQISQDGIGGSNAVAMTVPRGTNKRKIFTPPVSVSNGAEIDLQFKLIDAKSGKNVTSELIASEGFALMISFQDICSTSVKVTSTYSVGSALAAADDYFKFPFMLKYNDGGNLRAQIEFSNLSDYQEILLLIDEVVIQPRG